MTAADKSLKKIVYSYGDTDSYHLLGKYYKKLEKKGFFGSGLGYLDNDYEDGGIILKEINLGPKNYYNVVLTESGKLIDTKKCKGIWKDMLSKDLYYKALKGEATLIKRDKTSLKKINKKVCKNDLENGFNNFNIKEVKLERTFNKNNFSKMELRNNLYLPFGYEGKLV